MKFNLKKDLCFFDIETTGLNVVKDRIIQIAIIKYYASGKEPTELEMLINPGIPISEEAMAVHGITPKMLANKPLFSQVAKQLYDFFEGADIAGYNSNRFDVPLLMEEFARAGYNFTLENRNLIDAQTIFFKMEPRTLNAAYRLYTGKKLENAHDALADVRATVEVLKGQIEKYEGQEYIDGNGEVKENPIKNDMKALGDFTYDKTKLDVTNRLKYGPNGEVVFNFGKYIGRPVAEVFKQEQNYYNWMMQKDFSIQVKRIIKEIYEKQVRNSR